MTDALSLTGRRLRHGTPARHAAGVDRPAEHRLHRSSRDATSIVRNRIGGTKRPDQEHPIRRVASGDGEVAVCALRQLRRTITPMPSRSVPRRPSEQVSGIGVKYARGPALLDADLHLCRAPRRFVAASRPASQTRAVGLVQTYTNQRTAPIITQRTAPPIAA